MKCKSRRLEMKVGVIMNTVNLSGELNVKLLRFGFYLFKQPVLTNIVSNNIFSKAYNSLDIVFSR